MARLLSKNTDEEERQLTSAQQAKIDQAADAAFKSMDEDGDGKIS